MGPRRLALRVNLDPEHNEPGEQEQAALPARTPHLGRHVPECNHDVRRDGGRSAACRLDEARSRSQSLRLRASDSRPRRSRQAEEIVSASKR